MMDSKLRCAVALAKRDNEILDFIVEKRPSLVAIDAPLTLPRGRRSLEGSGPSMRECDRALKRLGLKPLPLTFKAMKQLTIRGIGIKRSLEGLGFRVIEVFPNGAQRVLGLPTKREGIENLRKALRSLGVKGVPDDQDGDILDAITCALVGLMYLRGECIELGDPREGVIIMPRSFK